MNQPPTPPRGKPAPVLLIFLLLPLLGLLAAVGFALANTTGSRLPPTPLPVTLADMSLVNKAAPNFELPALDGGTYRLSSYRGRVVFLNFWATWCEPCVREMPALQQFAQAASGAVIFAINHDETPAEIQAFLDDNGVSTLTVLLDESARIHAAYNASRLPTTYVIDPAGIVRYMHLGEVTVADLQAYVDELAG